MRIVLLLALLLVIGCDTTGVDLVPFSESLIVELEDNSVLRLTTDWAPGCATPMDIESTDSGNELAVDVHGLRVPEGPVCLAIIPSTWTHPLPAFSETLQLEITHNGETDVYRVTGTQGGLVLEPVRTTVTRPGPR